MNTRERRIGRIKSAILQWLGLSIGGGGPHTHSDAGPIVTVDHALQLSTVWACVRLLAETISTLPCQLYERGSDNTRKLATNHNLYQLLHNQPNADMTAVQFWECILASMLLYGYGIGEKVMSGETIVAVNFLLPDRVARHRLSSGRMEYSYLEWDGRTRRTLDESRLFLAPAFSLDGVVGLSTIQYGANVFGAAMAADKAAGKMFANAMQPAGVLSVDKILKPSQREELRGSLSEFSGSENTGKTFVAEAGMKYERLTIPPEDAQLLETRGFGVEEICRWFRVPPFMVGHSEKSTSWGTGLEQQMIGFLTFSLRPWLSRIEQAIRRCLLTPQERLRYFAEFSIEGLMRADSAGRASFYATAAQNGWMTRNEIRALENRPPVEGGNVLTVQSNLIALARVADAPQATEQLRSALTAFLAESSQENRTDATS